MTVERVRGTLASMGQGVQNIPFWKLRREAARPFLQAKSRIATTFSTPYHDLVLARKRTTSPGRLPERDRIAIFVIFPHKGLAASHLRTIRHLADKGYAPLVVSNLPLGDAEREQVLARCWRLIERPNYGYDFGAYRDGILSIGEQLGRLQRLVLVNDSCWYPLPGSDDWLGKAEALGLDFVGASASHAVDILDVDDLDRMTWHFDMARKESHYGSFALSLSGRVTSDRRFLRFWKRLVLSNLKEKVVRHGEIGLTHWALRHGFSHGAVYDARRLDEEFRALPPDVLLHMVERLVPAGDRQSYAKKKDILRSARSDGIDRDRLEKFALLVVARLGMSYSLADYLIERHSFPFLKKSPLWLDAESSRILLEITEEMGPEADYILAEARELVPDRMASIA